MAVQQVAVDSPYSNIAGGYVLDKKVNGALKCDQNGSWLFQNGDRWFFGPGPDRACVPSDTTAKAPHEAKWPVQVISRVVSPKPSPPSIPPSLWRDPSFPHEDSSVGLKLPFAVEWRPCRHLKREMELFREVSPAGLLQGAVGDCWLVSALAAFAEYPKRVEGLFKEKGVDEKTGKYCVRLFDIKKGAMVDVEVDEFVPVFRDVPWWFFYPPAVFLRPARTPAMWMLLVEKACAKMLGSFGKLHGGNCSMAFRLLTGCKDSFAWVSDPTDTSGEAVWRKMDLAKEGEYFMCHPGMCEKRKGSSACWEEMKTSKGKRYLLAASIGGDRGNTGEKKRADGLVENHAYSLLHVCEEEGHRLILLRNPWGNDNVWNGKYSDGDKVWLKSPKLKAALTPVEERAGSGSFWMGSEDFLRIFSHVFVCAEEMAKPGEETAKPPVPKVKTLPVGSAPLEGVRDPLPPGTLVQEHGTNRLLSVVEPVKGGKDGEGTSYLCRVCRSRYWICTACGEDNRRTRPKCNCCNGPRVLPEGEDSTLVLPSSHLIIPEGTVLYLHGLSSLPFLNGGVVAVRAFHRGTGRYEIDVQFPSESSGMTKGGGRGNEGVTRRIAVRPSRLGFYPVEGSDEGRGGPASPSAAPVSPSSSPAKAPPPPPSSDLEEGGERDLWDGEECFLPLPLGKEERDLLRKISSALGDDWVLRNPVEIPQAEGREKRTVPAGASLIPPKPGIQPRDLPASLQLPSLLAFLSKQGGGQSPIASVLGEQVRALMRAVQQVVEEEEERLREAGVRNFSLGLNREFVVRISREDRAAGDRGGQRQQEEGDEEAPRGRNLRVIAKTTIGPKPKWT
uniref:Calpain catalytic domain-containing protein n=1 Tax=Chromera velia CCMP2878 TaxID=1169474 RepID=A0A0G4HX90_9ALVE|eukprot:Cvel_9230.t1-p1 / transcript=Cvel_9230.t1 / gene=Cvel_9230 / organism=Chromera_velia_CCMP2878 / gene_product=Calpain-15, putative / transcript_product=Calpain-15, putative / location=Cvel_scaffold526:72397-75326(+) / protein_length=839 / sequence_SO=supercontig / SO=protein_coding / is_pseudo=false